MLIKLVRYKNKISYEMYKEIINNYRLIIDKLDLLNYTNFLKYEFLMLNLTGLINYGIILTRYEIWGLFFGG